MLGVARPQVLCTIQEEFWQFVLIQMRTGESPQSVDKFYSWQVCADGVRGEVSFIVASNNLMTSKLPWTAARNISCCWQLRNHKKHWNRNCILPMWNELLPSWLAQRIGLVPKPYCLVLWPFLHQELTEYGIFSSSHIYLGLDLQATILNNTYRLDGTNKLSVLNMRY